MKRKADPECSGKWVLYGKWVNKPVRSSWPINAEDKPRSDTGRGSWAWDASKEDILEIIENAPCGIVVNRRPFGKVLQINRVALENMGYTLDEVPTAQVAGRMFIPDPKRRRGLRKDIKRRLARGDCLIVGKAVCKDGTAQLSLQSRKN